MAAKNPQRSSKPRRRPGSKRKSRRSRVEAAVFELPSLFHLEVADTLDHVSKIVGRAIGEVAREVDATHGQLQVITAVARSPEGLTARQVADALAIRPGSLTGMLDQLERRGAIARNPVPGDARQQLIVLRPGAQELIDALERADQKVGVLLEPLDSDTIRRLGETVVRLEDAMREDIAQPLPESLRITSPDGIRKPVLRDDDPDNPGGAASADNAGNAAGAADVAGDAVGDGDAGATVGGPSAASTPERHAAPTPTRRPAEPSPAELPRKRHPAREPIPEPTWRRGFTIASKVISAVDGVRRRRDD